MDFRATAHTAGELSSDMAMDPTMQDAQDPRRSGLDIAPPPDSDGGDPATPGGPSMYNGAPPFGQPATSDPAWLDPSKQTNTRGVPIPHIEGPNQMANTLHNARAASYAAKTARGAR